MDAKLSRTAEKQIARIETDLTEDEKTIIAENRKNFRDHPEEYVSLSECMARNGMTRERLDRMPLTKMVYNV